MSKKWVVTVERETESEEAYTIRLGVAASVPGETMRVLTVCSTLKALQGEVAGLKKELDQALAEAETQVKALAQPQEGRTEERLSPEAIWKHMASLPSDEDMFGYFNALDDDSRQQVAEFVLTKVNMFRGRGPAFAESYNVVSHQLEE